ncbi:protein phosphatase 2C Ptc3 [Schizosaccharomyces japonicus yFS275]|uniref:protein-serine/threonine phosphatase n=1 Tax=Schizosaccharomyces japonicus (strain yFS275 / FY16936) TaxID=402676 RepID=B6K5C3_SCHJY|nr:protein phosphatase 2C Ptc3 [Schizosaccharomyces japonicus yFS275]EEB08727.1 protein phosphatase 2C Ptc3 [Schizosaccharomyces japonicus yFS275]
MGQTLSEPVTDKHSLEGGNEHVVFGISSMQGWRISMEDAHSVALHMKNKTVEEAIDFFAVYDGHGGDKVANWCGEHLPKLLEQSEDFQKGDFEAALKQTFVEADKTILEDERFHTDPSGCTATVILRVGRKLYCANAGDSRTVLGARGVAKPLSVDHKPSNDEEKARICAAGGRVDFGRVNGNLALSRAIGDFEFKSSDLPPEKQIVTAVPDVVCHELTDDDEFVILACDGIWDCKTSQQVVEFVRRGITAHLPLQKIAENLMDCCVATDAETTGLGCDNMTVCIVGLLNNMSVEQWMDEIAKRVENNDGPCAPPEYAELPGSGWTNREQDLPNVNMPFRIRRVDMDASLSVNDKNASEDAAAKDSEMLHADSSLAAGFRLKEHFFPLSSSNSRVVESPLPSNAPAVESLENTD